MDSRTKKAQTLLDKYQAYELAWNYYIGMPTKEQILASPGGQWVSRSYRNAEKEEFIRTMAVLDATK